MHTDFSARIRAAILMAAVGLMLLAGGCVRQQLDLGGIKQAPAASGAAAQHFEQSSYSIYLLFDLIPVKRASVPALMQAVNPQDKPVANLRVTSQGDVWTAVVNWINGGAAERGFIISMNKVTVAGDLVQ